MASQAENDCLSNPNFAVICSFMDRYGETLGLPEIGYKDLQEWIEDGKKVNPLLIDLHVRLLRRIHKKLSNVTADRWERGVVKFCYKYSNVDAWEIERFGYKLAKISTKLKLLKNLMESQFDCNNKFKDKVNEIPVEEMRFQPVGRDKDGMAYWYLLDKELNLRVYREHQDDVDSESWELVCRNREDLAKLVTGLETGTGMKLDKQESSDQSEPVSDFNEDSRDSFKQKTPLGPSPLTIKQAPGDGESNDFKQQLVLKISKSDTKSPSKMLKDKFVKEKGSEIKRIMCKMKEEGLINSESEDEDRIKDKSLKKEVDCLLDSKDVCEESLAKDDGNIITLDSFMKGKVDNMDFKTDIKEEKPDDIVNGEENLEKGVSSKGDVENLEVLENRLQEFKSKEINATSEVEKNPVKMDVSDNSPGEGERGDNKEKHSDNVDGVICSEHTVYFKDKETKLQNNIEENTKTKSILENSKVLKEMDQEKSTKDCTSETERDEINIPQKDSPSEIAIKIKFESQSDIIETSERSESSLNRGISYNMNEHANTTNQGNKFKQSAAVISEDKNDKSEMDEKEENAKEIDKRELSDETQNKEDIGNDSAVNTSKVPAISVSSQANEKSESAELLYSSEKCSSKTSEQNIENDNKTAKQLFINETEVRSSDDCTENESHKTVSNIESADEVSVKNNLENLVKNIDTDEPRKDTESDVSDNVIKIKVSEEDVEEMGTGKECKSYSKECKSYVIEKSVDENSVKEDVEGIEAPSDSAVLKKARKRKNKEINSESCSSSTDEDVDLESKQPCKRPVKAAVRKSPVKQLDEKDIMKETGLNNDGEINGSFKSENKHDIDSDTVKKEVIRSKECESNNKQDIITNPDDVPKKAEKINYQKNEADIKAEEKALNTNNKYMSGCEKERNVEQEVHLKKDKNGSEITEKVEQIIECKKSDNDVEEKAEEGAADVSEKFVCESKEKDNLKEINENEKKTSELEGNADQNTSELDEKNDFANEVDRQPQRNVKGLVAHSKRGKSKAQKRQAENSDDTQPAEPASKRSKLRGRVSSRGRGKRRGVNFDSSSSDDDLPLSQVVGRGRGSNSRRGGRKAVGGQQTKATKEQTKKKKVEQKDVKTSSLDMPAIPADLSEEETGRRRSARVRNMRARKKSPSPDYVPSDLDVSDDDFLDDDFDDEFILKSKKRKKREPKEVVEEVPKGRNALRHEAKANKKGGKVKEEEEEEEEAAACVKCLRSHQPEWILLCDKCDAGYHTACLRPPLMIIPDGDWFCPPCEHTSLKEKLEENLKQLDQAILKNDRMVRRKERLAFVSVSLDNVLKEPEPGEIKKERPCKKANYKDSEYETGTESSNETQSSLSTTESESSSDVENTRHKKSKQKFVQRACRSKKSVSYRFEEFDELIMDAIEEDLSIPKEPKPRKVKPPGISRGKDMSNILGASDEEAPKKPVRKRKPRLTELDEDIDDDDDTDDYQLSDASNATDATKSSIYESEDVSEDSIESSWRLNTRSTRKSHRKGGRNRKFKDDFVVESDFESEEDSKRRSRRRPRKSKINYKEINSDETEVEDIDDSFHSSELSDSDFEDKRKNRIDKKKKPEIKERQISGKRQRIRKVLSSSESSEEDSDESRPRTKKGKKPPSKTARYDSDETDESLDRSKIWKSKDKKIQQLSDKSESETEENDETDSSETEVSDSDSTKNKKKTKEKIMKKVIKSDSEEDDRGDDEEKRDDSQDTGKDSEESGWEEIGVDTDEIVSDSKKLEEKISEKGDQLGKSDMVCTDETITGVSGKQEHVSETRNKVENCNFNENKMESDTVETMEMKDEMAFSEKDNFTAVVTSQKKMRGRKPKSETVNEDNTTQEMTPKKRGRKPKAKPEASETNSDEIPVKKKRGHKIKIEKVAEVSGPDIHVDKGEADSGVYEEQKTEDTSENQTDAPKKIDEAEKSEEQKVDNKNATEISQMIEKGKDDSPLSARNKHNAPVGVVKPEVRQGVIVENKQVTDGRLNENRPGENPVNPLQGMRDLAMGNQNIQGSHQSSFTPYTQSSYQAPNMPSFIGQPGFQNYQNPAPPYGQSGPGPHHPHHIGPQGMPQGHPQYPPNQGNSYQQHSSYMGPMQQGQSFFQGNYRPTGGQGEGLGHQNPHGANPQYYHPHQGQYQGQRHGYPDYQLPYHMGPQGLVSIPPNQQCPGPYPGMPYNYSNMPQQDMHRPGFSPPISQQSISPNHQVRPPTRLPGPPPLQRSSPLPRVETDAPNRGFMMDNILKPTSEGTSHDVEDSAEVSDIDRYTSFLCKSTD